MSRIGFYRVIENMIASISSSMPTPSNDGSSNPLDAKISSLAAAHGLLSLQHYHCPSAIEYFVSHAAAVFRTGIECIEFITSNDHGGRPRISYLQSGITPSYTQYNYTLPHISRRFLSLCTLAKFRPQSGSSYSRTLMEVRQLHWLYKKKCFCVGVAPPSRLLCDLMTPFLLERNL